MLIVAIPRKKTTKAPILRELILPARKSRQPIRIFAKAQITFVSGDESPCPGGSAKGVGKDLLKFH